jgi:hypothetical protein
MKRYFHNNNVIIKEEIEDKMLVLETKRGSIKMLNSIQIKNDIEERIFWNIC